MKSRPDYPRRDLPVIIPCFNNPTYLRGMVEQLATVGLGNLVIVDNASQFGPHLELLRELEENHTVIHKNENAGPRHLMQDTAFYETLPQHFCITDPDLAFHPELPSDFIQRLIDLTEAHQIGKAGFALDISEPEKMIQTAYQIGEERCRIWEWEAQFWQTPIEAAGEDPAYRALIDTTFAVYNKAFFRAERPLEAIRVAGRFTARHLPWYREHQLPPDEAAFYRATSKHSFYVGTPPKA